MLLPTLIQKHVLMVITFRSTGILKLMNIKKYLLRKNIFVQTGQVIKSQLYLLLATKPTYYNSRRSFSTPKPKMSNSFELLIGSVANIQKQYEMLSDIVTEAGGKVHSSQRDRNPKTGMLDLMVYYEVPEGQRDKVKRKFDNTINQMVI